MLNNILHKGGEVTKTGTYWNISTGTRHDVTEGQTLQEGNYVRANIILMLLSAPMIGLLFAVFLPFIGIVMSINLLFKKVSNTTKELSYSSFSFGWRPLEAYFAGKKNKEVKSKEKK